MKLVLQPKFLKYKNARTKKLKQKVDIKTFLRDKQQALRLFFVSALLRDYSLCWDHWKQYMTPTLDTALLISSRAGADQTGVG